MTPAELDRILMRLDPLTREGVAILLGRTSRTLRRWLAGGRAIPPEAATLLRLLVARKITPRDIEIAAAKI